LGSTLGLLLHVFGIGRMVLLQFLFVSYELLVLSFHNGVKPLKSFLMILHLVDQFLFESLTFWQYLLVDNTLYFFPL